MISEADGPRARGRPSSYTPEIADAICEAVATSSRGLEWICGGSDEFPHAATVWRWIAERPDFREKYARAKERQADFMADEIVDISDNGTNDYIIAEGGVPVVNHDHIARSRLRVDSRKWLASKLAPKKYGEKIDLEHSGGLRVERVERVIVDPAADTDR